MALASVLAEFLQRVRRTGIPAAAIEQGGRVFLDCMGGAIAGSRDRTAQVVHEYIAAMQTSGPCTVIGTDLRVFPEHAALANGTAAHALDIDDTSRSMPGHPSVAVLPAALALGEWTVCNGASMVTAFVLGFEVEAKLGRLMEPELGETPWHSAGTLGTLGAAMAASYLLDLSVEQTVNALGIAASLASGLSSNHGSMTKPFHPGNAARNGILAGQLAQRGFTAQGEAFEAEMGFLQAFAGRACQARYRTNPGWLERELGNPFDVVEPGTDIKLYPSCNLTHPAIDACLELLQAYPEVHVQRITRVECQTGRKIPYLISERLPMTGLEGKFSLEYCLALAMLKKRVEVDDFSDATLTDPQFDAFMKKVVVGADSTLLSAGGWSYGATRVVVNLEDGSVFSRTVENPKGSIQKPLDEKELHGKYRKLASRALSPERVRESLSLLQNIQRLPDIRQLTGQLGASS